jgi:hypothetical protein
MNRAIGIALSIDDDAARAMMWKLDSIEGSSVN